ncbi:hypothetical protein PR202_gb19688 [Eleusine coracana subsp. coracana]|uniref:Xylanase inhibitor N-terminal domain-containing protein n=1 Tax=Eleusine coracana subsp. coracana TaxID=191504 RepID=A0AAV5FAN4_ELECO|nr:hypothetical protein PR202_gb19688 [Eleusine coracana subsp. coracana]
MAGLHSESRLPEDGGAMGKAGGSTKQAMRQRRMRWPDAGDAGSVAQTNFEVRLKLKDLGFKSRAVYGKIKASSTDYGNRTLATISTANAASGAVRMQLMHIPLLGAGPHGVGHPASCCTSIPHGAAQQPHLDTVPVFDASLSSTFAEVPCGFAVCQDLPAMSCSAGGSSSTNNNQLCVYRYSYGDGSVTIGGLVADTFVFGDGSAVSGMVFGCGLNNTGIFK